MKSGRTWVKGHSKDKGDELLFRQRTLQVSGKGLINNGRDKPL